MTNYILIFAFIIFAVFCFIMFFKTKKETSFKKKQFELEQSIDLEKNKLKNQKQKTAIVDDFKKSIKASNQELFVKIADMNNSLFEEIHKNISK